MIHLKIHANDTKHLQLLDFIKSRSLAYKLDSSELPVEPEMIAFGEVYLGIEAIKKGLDDLEKLYEAWYECRCDKYESE